MKIARMLVLVVMLLSPLALLLSQKRDIPREIVAAQTSLQTASNELQHAGGEWGGHRAAALKHVQAALNEVNQAEAWAREHGDIK